MNCVHLAGPDAMCHEREQDSIDSFVSDFEGHVCHGNVNPSTRQPVNPSTVLEAMAAMCGVIVAFVKWR